jgi:predicted  nucleic acid-binding Zn-ribbon protein
LYAACVEGEEGVDDIRQQLNLLEKQRLRAVRGVRKLTAVLNYVSAARAELEALREEGSLSPTAHQDQPDRLESVEEDLSEEVRMAQEYIKDIRQDQDTLWRQLRPPH